MKSLLTHFFFWNHPTNLPRKLEPDLVRHGRWQISGSVEFLSLSHLSSRKKTECKNRYRKSTTSAEQKKNQNKTLNTRQWQTQIQLIHRVIVQHFTITPYISPRFIFNYTRPASCHGVQWTALLIWADHEKDASKQMMYNLRSVWNTSRHFTVPIALILFTITYTASVWFHALQTRECSL